jgi:tetratricopeptide (TPR) repeat protein
MISVCFITKNEAKWIAECIEHLKPIVKEFIVVDTGSTDNTMEIARAAGAIVHQMPWPDDFSAARNESLKYATQPWILKIDPDERLDPKDFPRLTALTQNKEVPAFQFWTRAYTNDPSRVSLLSYQLCTGEYPEREKGYRGFVTYPNIRLFRNSPTTKFVGKIHETVEPTLPGYEAGKSTPVPPALDIYFHHYGHTDAATAEKGKSPLYAKLMREELERNPNNWYVLFEMGIESFRQGKFQEAVDYFIKSDRAHPNKPQVLSNLGLALVCVGQGAEAEKILKNCLIIDPNYHDAALNLGICYFEAGYLQKAVEAFDRCLQISPKSFMALRAKGQAVAHLGNLPAAENYFREAIKIMPPFLDAKIDLALVLQKLEKKEESKKLLEEVLREDSSNARARAVLTQ